MLDQAVLAAYRSLMKKIFRPITEIIQSWFAVEVICPPSPEVGSYGFT